MLSLINRISISSGGRCRKLSVTVLGKVLAGPFWGRPCAGLPVPLWVPLIDKSISPEAFNHGGACLGFGAPLLASPPVFGAPPLAASPALPPALGTALVLLLEL